VADGLVAASLLGTEDAARIHHLWWYGQLIANTDNQDFNTVTVGVNARFGY
jgi:hypothetical protein